MSRPEDARANWLARPDPSRYGKAVRAYLDLLSKVPDEGTAKLAGILGAEYSPKKLGELLDQADEMSFVKVRDPIHGADLLLDMRPYAALDRDQFVGVRFDYDAPTEE